MKGTTSLALYEQVRKTGNEDVQWQHRDILSKFHHFIKLLLVRLKLETADTGKPDRPTVLFSKGNRKAKL